MELRFLSDCRGPTTPSRPNTLLRNFVRKLEFRCARTPGCIYTANVGLENHNCEVRQGQNEVRLVDIDPNIPNERLMRQIREDFQRQINLEEQRIVRFSNLTLLLTDITSLISVQYETYYS